jgi:hypothetical protein
VVLHVTRGAVRVDGTVIIGAPKSDAGIRDVAIPAHLIPMLRDHLSHDIPCGKEVLRFPATNGGTLSPSTSYGRAPIKGKGGYGFYAARVAAGRPDLRWQDQRHTAGTLA